MATTDPYFPDPPPLSASPEVRLYLERELQKIALRLNAEIEEVGVLEGEPATPEDGTISYADGVNWNPGGGAGFYGRVSGAWQKL